MLTLQWAKGDHGEFLDFFSLDFKRPDLQEAEGVYLIWLGGENARAIRIGQGKIKSRLSSHRKNPKIRSYENRGLYVSWAEVPHHLRDGVEAYLGGQFKPKVGSVFPNVYPVRVNLPGK